MEKNFYEILDIEERLLPYLLEKNDDREKVSKYLDKKIKEAYKLKRKKIEEEYQIELKKLKKESNFLIGAKKLIIGKEYISKKIRDANIKGKQEVEKQYMLKVKELEGKYKFKFQELDFAYENVETEELRQIYNENIQYEENKYSKYVNELSNEIQEEIKKDQIKETYSKINQYNPEIIKKIENGNYKGESLVLKKMQNNPIKVSLQDQRNTTIKQTGTVLFANCVGCESYVNEYQVERYVDKKLKIDTVYTNLDLPKLGFDKRKCKPTNTEYYNCVTNKLLSEDAIEGSKHNGGYIGLVEKNNRGYDITIDKKLSEEEVENLTAVIILKKREEKAKSRTKQKRGEDR